MSLYMVIENFKNGEALPVYPTLSGTRSTRTEWIVLCFELGERNVDRCWQLMKTEDRALLDEWIANWSDIIERNPACCTFERSGEQNQPPTVRAVRNHG